MTDVTWEYRVLPATSEMVAGAGEALEQQLDEFGVEGWELVAVDASAESTLYVFKRPLPVVVDEEYEEGEEGDYDDEDYDDEYYDDDGTIRVNPPAGGRR